VGRPDSATRFQIRRPEPRRIEFWRIELSRIELAGEVGGSPVAVLRREEQDFLLVTSGFRWVSEYPVM
jgi:hypothetical protein